MKHKLKKNIQVGKINYLIILLSIFFVNNNQSLAAEINFIQIKILDKVSSKNNLLTIKIGEEKKFKNLLIKPLKCINSEFDDNPEVTAYLQVKDISLKNNNEVFVFNGWTFLSSPSINPFDHPVYDIWLTKCS